MEETKYRRVDIEGGYIYDQDDIDYYRSIQKIDVMDNYLLGDFNMVGTYVINNSINEELSKMRKYYTGTYERNILCESSRKFLNRPLKFVLKVITNYPKIGSTMASLELLEEINKGNGFYKNTNTSLVESKVFEGTDAINAIYKYFNIQKEQDGAVTKQESDFDVRHITERFDMMLKMKKMTAGLMTKYDKELYDQRIALLLKNKKATIILEEFNKRVFHAKDAFLDKDSKNYYRQLNQILDSVLEVYGYEIQGEKELIKSPRKVQKDISSELEKMQAVVDAKMDIEKVNAKKIPIAKSSAKSDSKSEAKTKSEAKSSKPEEKKADKKAETAKAGFDGGSGGGSGFGGDRSGKGSKNTRYEKNNKNIKEEPKPEEKPINREDDGRKIKSEEALNLAEKMEREAFNNFNKSNESDTSKTLEL